MTWLPDGRGLDPLTLDLIAEHDVTVHLRLENTETRAARGACGDGLGQLWSGIATEVTCPPCLEVVHA